MNYKNKKHNSVVILTIVVIAGMGLDIFIWHADFFSPSSSMVREYFLSVGQGNAQLIVFPGNITVMTDAGPTDAVVGDLRSILPQGDDYIDLAIISSHEAADFSGYNFILDHYHVGAFVYNGRDDDVSDVAWSALKQKIQAEHIPLITLGEGDKVSVDKNEIDILSPSPAFAESPDLADSALVVFIKTPAFKTLLTADAGTNVEDRLLAQAGANLHVDVLTIGDQNASSSLISADSFFDAVNPAVAIMQTVVKNTKSESSPSTFDRSQFSAKILILTTVQNGTIEVYLQNEKLKIVRER